jgi:hypothetical protein
MSDTGLIVPGHDRTTPPIRRDYHWRQRQLSSYPPSLQWQPGKQRQSGARQVPAAMLGRTSWPPGSAPANRGPKASCPGFSPPSWHASSPVPASGRWQGVIFTKRRITADSGHWISSDVMVTCGGRREMTRVTVFLLVWFDYRRYRRHLRVAPTSRPASGLHRLGSHPNLA